MLGYNLIKKVKGYNLVNKISSVINPGTPKDKPAVSERRLFAPKNKVPNMMASPTESFINKGETLSQGRRTSSIEPYVNRNEVISSARPVEEKSGFLNKTLRTVLPKGAEEFFNITKPGEQTGAERVKRAEAAKQNLFRKERRAQNVSQVLNPRENYVAPKTFKEKLDETTRHGFYGKNVWSGFMKPAIGILAEQTGLSMNDPRLREWGEQFADRTFEEETRKASAQSIADAPGPLEGGLKDPRFYAKTISQTAGFIGATLGSAVAVTAATKSPVAGGAAAFAVGAGLEDAGAYESMINDGVSPDDASKAAKIYGVVASVIENATGIKPAMGTAGLIKTFAVKASKDSAIKKFMKTWIQEGVVEEGSQQLVQNFIQKFVDENKGLWDDVVESMIGGLVGALPLAGGAQIATNNRKNIKKYLKENPPGLTIKDVSKGSDINLKKVREEMAEKPPMSESLFKGEATKESNTFYSGAKGDVVETKLDLDNKKVATIQGDQRTITDSKSYVEADQKLYDEYSKDYDFIKIEHPEMPQKGDEYYDLNEKKWYSQDKAVAEVYAMQSHEAKYADKFLFEGKPLEPKSKAILETEKKVETEKDLQKRILTARKEHDIEQRSNLNPPEPTEFPEQVYSVRDGVSSSPILENIREYKDISNAKVQFRDIYRNTRQVFGEDKAEADKILLDPLDNAKSESINFLQKETDELYRNVPFGVESKESKYIQLRGEGKITDDKLIAKFGKSKTAAIIKADLYFRKKYDELLKGLNKVEMMIYPNSPHKWTPKRQDYYRHFSEATNEYSRLQYILENPIKIDPLLVGISENTEPRSRWASFKQKRLGKKTKVDAVGGYLNYLKSASYAIHIDPQIGRFREFAGILARATSDSKNLNHYIRNINNIADELSGKTPLLDRAIMEHIPGGRTGLSALAWLNNRVKANTILGNFKSSLAQILNVPQGVATAGPINSIKGGGKAMAQVFIPGPMDQSNFLKERFFTGFNKFDKGMIKNTKKFFVWMVGALDEVGTKFIWSGQYEKAKSKGEADPVKFADNKTRDLVAGRSIAKNLRSKIRRYSNY